MSFADFSGGLARRFSLGNQEVTSNGELNMSDLTPKRYWRGSPPVQCDFAQRTSGKHDIRTNFVDGRTLAGPWAIMCLACLKRYGVGVGSSIGQHYQQQEDGKWLKVEG